MPAAAGAPPSGAGSCCWGPGRSRVTSSRCCCIACATPATAHQVGEVSAGLGLAFGVPGSCSFAGCVAGRGGSVLQSPPPHSAECPSGQVYGDCANACPRVCAHLHLGTQCLLETCQPGCACPLGQVWLGSPSPPCSPRGSHCHPGDTTATHHLGDPTATHHPGIPLPPREGRFLVTAGCPTGSAGWGLCPPRVVPLPASPHSARRPQPLAGAAAAGTRPGQPPPAPLQHLVGAAAPGDTPRRVTPCGWLSRGAGSSAGAGWALNPLLCAASASAAPSTAPRTTVMVGDSRPCAVVPTPQPPVLTPSPTVDCLWSPWSPWSPRSVTCGVGERLSHRRPLRQRLYEGAECLGSPTRRTPCSLPDCRGSPRSPSTPGAGKGGDRTVTCRVVAQGGGNNPCLLHRGGASAGDGDSAVSCATCSLSHGRALAGTQHTGQLRAELPGHLQRAAAQLQRVPVPRLRLPARPLPQQHRPLRPSRALRMLAPGAAAPGERRQGVPLVLGAVPLHARRAEPCLPVGQAGSEWQEECETCRCIDGQAACTAGCAPLTCPEVRSPGLGGAWGRWGREGARMRRAHW